jgi:hypothetical protein
MTENTIIQKRPPKSAAAAGILSGIFPGIGQIYNGEYLKGILFIIIFAGLVSMQPHRGQPFLGLLLAGFWFFQLIEAIQTAKTINRRALVEAGGETAAGTPEATPLAATPAARGSVFWGIVLVALGGIFLLANFSLIDFDRVIDFWPLVVIVIGIKMIADYFLKKSA